MLNRDDMRLYAGLVAASGVAAAKQLRLRDAPPAVPARFRPSGLNDLPRLFAGGAESVAQRVGRLSAAALLYSVDKANDKQPGRLLHQPEERAALNELVTARAGHHDTDRSCPHCRLLYGTLYGKHQRPMPPIAVVNHSARVNITFDPDTNISEAKICHFQVILPESIASNILRLAHPMRWAEPPGSLFRRAQAVNADGTRGQDFRGDRATILRNWNARAADGEAFIYEDVLWPLNDSLCANSENIIRFREVKNTESELSYTYSLQRSIRSNFGVAWEPGGLDLDGGVYAIRIVRIEDILGGAFPLNLRTRDVLEMRANFDPDADKDLYAGNFTQTNTPESEKATPAQALEVALALTSALRNTWPELEPFCLVDITASKELHFTVPENGPVELWHMLTWTAPAILFAFLNKAVCHAPHLLLDPIVRQLKEGKPIYVQA